VVASRPQQGHHLPVGADGSASRGGTSDGISDHPVEAFGIEMAAVVERRQRQCRVSFDERSVPTGCGHVDGPVGERVAYQLPMSGLSNHHRGTGASDRLSQVTRHCRDQVPIG